MVVQIPALKPPYRSGIEKLLGIFDQHRKVSDHILEIDEAEYPEEYSVLIRRLMRAVSEQEVIDTMDAEDDILEELENMERKIEERDRKLEEKERIIEELQRRLEERK